jgi:adenylate kinase family enzyme
MKMPNRIHILGPSGSGTTTLGENLAQVLGIKHLDADDFFWKQTPVLFSEKRPIEERLEKINQEIEGLEEWVISGSLCGWGDPLIAQFTSVFFLWIPWEVREIRLRKRGELRHGKEALAPGGVMHDIHTAFIDWAGKYDSAGMEQRSRLTHEKWMEKLPSHIQMKKIEGVYDRETLVNKVLKEIESV